MQRLILLLIIWTAATPVAAEQGSGPRPNHLAGEKSPYLLQHVHNPVDWYPWGEAAFAKARKEGKPVFLSVGYSTCHWCHVMERESFSDPEIARLLNEHFIAVKVDREERPDVDVMVQAFLAATDNDGGWPANIFLTPDLDPFYGGTYFPARDRDGRLGLESIIVRLAASWSEHRTRIEATGEQMRRAVASLSLPQSSDAELDRAVVERAFAQLSARYERHSGGFSPAPKFPQPVIHELLLRYHVRHDDESAAQMSLATLRAMATGGIYDQIAGGFHRYSVDSEWHVPHFEKMLYDQAQLAEVYLSAFQLTSDETFRGIAAGTLDFVLESMTSPAGGFYSALDASSLPSAGADEKREGAFYTWSHDEAAALFDAETLPVVIAAFGMRRDGNVDPRLDPSGELEGRNVLTRRASAAQLAERFSRPAHEIESILQNATGVFARARSSRPTPHLDDKILTSWNGLMIGALARASQILDEPRYLDAAIDAARFAETRLRDPDDGRLWRRWRDGEAAVDGFAEDYAFLIRGLLDLYDASLDIRWIDLASELQQRQDASFWNDDAGYYSLAAKTSESGIIDVPGNVDSVLPSHNSVSAMNLMRLGQLTGSDVWAGRARAILQAFGGTLTSNPQTMPLMVAALSTSLAKPKQIIIAGTPGEADTLELLSLVHERYLPDRLLILADGSSSQKRLQEWMPFIEYVQPIAGKATAYVCEDFVCKLPSNSPSVVARQLDARPTPTTDGEPGDPASTSLSQPHFP